MPGAALPGGSPNRQRVSFLCLCLTLNLLQATPVEDPDAWREELRSLAAALHSGDAPRAAPGASAPPEQDPHSVVRGPERAFIVGVQMKGKQDRCGAAVLLHRILAVSRSATLLVIRVDEWNRCWSRLQQRAFAPHPLRSLAAALAGALLVFRGSSMCSGTLEWSCACRDLKGVA